MAEVTSKPCPKCWRLSAAGVPVQDWPIVEGGVIYSLSGTGLRVDFVCPLSTEDQKDWVMKERSSAFRAPPLGRYSRPPKGRPEWRVYATVVSDPGRKIDPDKMHSYQIAWWQCYSTRTDAQVDWPRVKRWWRFIQGNAAG